jgi:DNA ligase-associated metallophosphoesterase
MPEMVNVDFGGITLRLLHERGVYWPDQGVLFVADTHFGKEATFRHHAIPVPRGGTDGTLRQIASMLDATGAGRLVILGDMFHARSSLSSDVLDSMNRFFEERDRLRCTLVRGNHDARIGSLPSHWPLTIVDPGARIERVSMGHAPSDYEAGMELMLCGHIHPAIRFGVGDDCIRLACYWQHKQILHLPAIGRFTGTHSIRPLRGDRVWIVTDQEVIEKRTKIVANPFRSSIDNA